MPKLKAKLDKTKLNKMYGVSSKQNIKSRDFDNLHHNKPYNNFQYYATKYNFQPRWSYRKKRPTYKHFQKNPEKARSPSPFSGTEEYNLKKIQETSDMIKKRLMMPESEDVVDTPKIFPVNDENETENKKNDKSESDKYLNKINKKNVHYNVEEIHQKIITHITNLSHGKKMNLICANSSGYDVAIQQIHKQKRLELSKALRDMCSNQTVENSEVINSIMPDIGIKIEDLPLEVIEELSSTLDLTFDDISFLEKSNVSNIKTEIRNEIDVTFIESSPESTNLISVKDKNKICVTNIKQEILDIQDPSFKNDAFDDFPMEHNFNSFNQHSMNSEYYTPRECSNKEKSVNMEDTKVSVHLQTDILNFNSTSCQTDANLMENCFRIDENRVNNLDDAVKAMLEIDKEIARLTTLRQSIFLKLQKKQADETEINIVATKDEHKTQNVTQRVIENEDKITQNILDNGGNDNAIANIMEENDFDLLIEEKDIYYDQPINFEVIPEKILVMKVIEDTLLAASEKGKIYFINMQSGASEAAVSVSTSPITSICFWMTMKKRQLHILVGSSDTKLREYNYEKKEMVRQTNLKHSTQCMELAWNCVFIGTTKGSLMRYSLKQYKIEFEEKICEGRVMVLKAAHEGARRVLLVGTRNAAVCVRDAMSGLHLRTMNELVTPTVYSLILENSMVYCGTTFHDILVFSFHDGSLMYKYEATNSKGICRMKVIENLLFASCYNGNIYVYNIKTHKFVGVIEGPGGVILSMEVVKNLVIVGTMSLSFKSILIPEHILEHNKI